MKILGKTEPERKYGPDQYIAVISLDEINAVFDKAYADRIKELHPGQEIPISAGADFRNQIKNVCDSMADAMKAFEKSKATLMKFALMVQGIPERADGQQS